MRRRLTSASAFWRRETRPKRRARRRCGTAWPAVRFAVGIHPHQAGEFAGVHRPGRRDRPARPGGTSRVRDRRDRARLSLRFLAARRAAGGLPRAGRGSRVELRLPIVIHTREATDDTFRMLREEGAGEVRGVFHCFTGDEAMARAALDLDFYLSFAGIVTFPRAEGIRGSGEDRPGGSLSRRNRRAVPGARAAPRQAQRAGVCCRGDREAGRDSRRAGGRLARPGDRAISTRCSVLRPEARKLLKSNGLAR